MGLNKPLAEDSEVFRIFKGKRRTAKYGEAKRIPKRKRRAEIALGKLLEKEKLVE